MVDAPHRLNDADAMFLAVERASGVFYAPLSISISAGGHDPAAIAHLREVSARLLPAQRRRIVTDRFSPALPRWVDVPGFDPEQNTVRLAQPPGDGSMRAILDWAADWSLTPMDPNRPPWRSVAFENVTVDGVPGRLVTVSQTHHAVIDGQGATRLGKLTLQMEPDGPLPEMPPPVAPEHPTTWERWREGWAIEGEKAVQNARRGGAWLRWAAQDPKQGLERAREWGAAVQRMRSHQSRVPNSPILARTSRATRFDWFEIDWPGFQAGCKAAGCSVNDAFMGALSVAMHQYHLDHGHRVEQLRTAMAINTRKDDGPQGGNQVIGVMLGLPLLDDIRIAIKECGEVSRAHRDDTDVLRVIDNLRKVANRMPQALVARGTKTTLGGVDMQISNVQGIPRRYWVAGVESLAGMSFPTGGPGLSMTFISSRGTASLGMTTCPDSVKDPEHLADRVREGFAQVIALAG